MADTIREQIVKAIVAKLDAPGKPAATTVNRTRRRAVEPSELPMISVYDVREEVESATESRRSLLADRTLRVRVKCRAVGDDSAVDPLYSWAVKALKTDQSLGGLAVGLTEESTDWDTDDAGDADYSVSATDFLVRFTTSKQNPESKT